MVVYLVGLPYALPAPTTQPVLGGEATLPKRAEVPHCPRCGRTMRFVVQWASVTRPGMLVSAFRCESDGQDEVVLSPHWDLVAVPVAETSEPYPTARLTVSSHVDTLPHPDVALLGWCDDEPAVTPPLCTECDVPQRFLVAFVEPAAADLYGPTFGFGAEVAHLFETRCNHPGGRLLVG